MARGLSSTFMSALQMHTEMGLTRLVETVKGDSTLCLEIRENYINVYYRGGNLIKLSEKNGRYIAAFDMEYVKEQTFIKGVELEEKYEFSMQYVVNQHNFQQYALGWVLALPKVWSSSSDIDQWIQGIPWLKHGMDIWLGSHPKNEREFQQLVVRENNFGGSAKGTDYFICDIEYDNHKGSRFDLIGAHWPSTSSARKNNGDVRLAIIEMKYMDNALNGASGILDHINKTKESLALPELKAEMLNVFKQKRQLGLIDNQKDIGTFSNEKPEFIFVLANHDPDSGRLRNELKQLMYMSADELDKLPFVIKIATSNFMGYGLYDQSIYDLPTFMTIYKDRI